MPNILGKKLLEVANDFKESKKNDETFLDYYTKFLDLYLEILTHDMNEYFIKKELLKSLSTFDALYFIALTTKFNDTQGLFIHCSKI